MAKYNDMFNDKYTYLDLHLMFESVLEDALEDAQDALEIEHDFEELTNAEELALTEVYDKVEKEFYDKYGWKEDFIAQCEDVNPCDYDDDHFCLGDDKVCDKNCKDCPCAHPVEEFL